MNKVSMCENYRRTYFRNQSDAEGELELASYSK